MLQSKSSYQKKIDELHQQILAKARELHDISEQVEQKKREKSCLLTEIAKHGVELAEVKFSITKADERLQEKGSKKSKLVLEHESAVRDHEVIISKLMAKVKSLENEVTSLEKVKVALARTKKELDALYREVKLVNNSLQSKSQELEKIQKARDIALRETALIKKQGRETIEFIEKVVKDVQSQRNALKPYINEINSFYRRQDKPVPFLIKDWKPKFLHIRLHDFKKLKRGK